MSRLDASAARVTLRPRFFDRLCVFFLVLPGLQALLFAVLSMTSTAKQSTFHCDRAATTCRVFWPSLFGGNRYSYDLRDLKTSRLGQDKAGTSWVVDRGTGPLWLGQSTKDPKVIAEYQRFSADLQAFLGDPSRPTFDASYGQAKKPPSPWLLLAIGAVFLAFGLPWWHGWYAELELDSAAREITIHRRPRLFTGPRTQKYAASDLRLGEGVENHYIGRGQRAKFVRFELRDASGKRVFRYLTLYDARSRAKLDGDMQRLQDFFGRA